MVKVGAFAVELVHANTRRPSKSTPVLLLTIMYTQRWSQASNILFTWISVKVDGVKLGCYKGWTKPGSDPIYMGSWERKDVISKTTAL